MNAVYHLHSTPLSNQRKGIPCSRLFLRILWPRLTDGKFGNTHNSKGTRRSQVPELKRDIFPMLQLKQVTKTDVWKVVFGSRECSKWNPGWKLLLCHRLKGWLVQVFSTWRMITHLWASLWANSRGIKRKGNICCDVKKVQEQERNAGVWDAIKA